MGLSPAGTWVRRAGGAVLVALSLSPIHRVLADPRTGPAGDATVQRADATLALVWWSLLLVAGVALLLSRGLPRVDPGRWGAAVSARLEALTPGAIAAVAALVSGAACAAVAAGLFRGLPTLLDEMAQLLQARYMAAGMDGGPPPEPAAAWLIQNTLVTEGGWVSQYPPFHTALLSLGLGLGSVWLVGPILTAVTVFFTARIAHRLLPERPAVAAWGALLVGVSPFVLALGSGYLSHASAAALGAAGLWWTLRSADGSAAWAAAAGLCGGLLLATRPWTGVALGAVWLLAVWTPEAARRSGGWLVARLGLAAAGGVPAGIWLAGYNRRWFGDPLTFGYELAQGPAHGLGFHADPWGNAYGPLEALGYSGADLLQLGVHLFETPVPLVAVVGAYLWLTPALSRGARTLLAWAVIPWIANALYWHHGYHLGPRMLFEAAPAWILLVPVAVHGLLRQAPSGWPRRAVAWAVVLSAAGALTLGIPGRWQAYAWTPDTRARITVPPGAAGGLVFVHGGWAGRLSARLQGLGMRLDSVETAIRRNDACAVEGFVAAWARTGSRAEAVAEAPLDFRSLPGNAPGLEIVPLGPGSVVRVDPGRSPTPACRRQARSDRVGAIALAPLLWQGDLPGLERGRALFVRDLGPAVNTGVRAAYAARPAYLLSARTPEGPPELIPFEEGMRLLWGDDAPDEGEP